MNESGRGRERGHGILVVRPFFLEHNSKIFHGRSEARIPGTSETIESIKQLNTKTIDEGWLFWNRKVRGISIRGAVCVVEKGVTATMSSPSYAMNNFGDV